MQRRKFLATVGAFTAGTAAAIGTGAVSDVAADRSLEGDVVTDGNGYIEITPGPDNGIFTKQSGGQLNLDFGSVGSSYDAGQGLNPDSLNYFDHVFGIRNFSPQGPARITIERDGPNMGRVTFYNTNGSGNGPTPDDYFNITDGNYGGTGQGAYIHSEVNDQGVVGKGLLRVDVRVDLRNSGLSNGQSLSDLFTAEDDFTIVAEMADDVDTTDKEVTWGSDTVDFS